MCFSIYSDISILTIWFSSPNWASAKALLSSVLPTPVGPKNKNEPIGLLGSFIPALALLIAVAIDLIASSCPTTLLCKILSIFNNFSASSSSILFTGIPVHIETISAITSSFTVSFSLFELFQVSLTCSNCSFNFLCSSLTLAAFSKFWHLTASSFSLFILSILSSNSLISSGGVFSFSLTLEPASSIKSIALSGKNLSVIYLTDKSTAAFIAPSVIFTLWWASYLSLSISRILIAFSFVGSSTNTGWNLRSNAASFSICFLYSSIVVAPIICISPLANTGFKIFDASIEPSPVEPAPTIVCNSSINRIIFSLSLTSSITCFILSSNSPLYLAPANKLPISKVYSDLSFRVSGTLPLEIFVANPSATEVLPTPGSPIRTGLFFVLLLKIWITLCISFSLQITGSIFPFFASSVRFTPYLSKSLDFEDFSLFTSLFSAGSIE